MKVISRKSLPDPIPTITISVDSRSTDHYAFTDNQEAIRSNWEQIFVLNIYPELTNEPILIGEYLLIYGTTEEGKQYMEFFNIRGDREGIVAAIKISSPSIDHHMEVFEIANQLGPFSRNKDLAPDGTLRLVPTSYVPYPLGW